MLIAISGYIRKVAELIELDDTPTEEEIYESRVLHNEPSKNPDIGVQPDKKTQSTPKIRRPRRLPESKKKWNDSSKTELMKNYMQEYRADGKVYETKGIKNFYVKKPKV